MRIRAYDIKYLKSTDQRKSWRRATPKMPFFEIGQIWRRIHFDTKAWKYILLNYFNHLSFLSQKIVLVLGSFTSVWFNGGCIQEREKIRAHLLPHSRLCSVPFFSPLIWLHEGKPEKKRIVRNALCLSSVALIRISKENACVVLMFRQPWKQNWLLRLHSNLCFSAMYARDSTKKHEDAFLFDSKVGLWNVALSFSSPEAKDEWSFIDRQHFRGSSSCTESAQICLKMPHDLTLSIIIGINCGSNIWSQTTQIKKNKHSTDRQM